MAEMVARIARHVLPDAMFAEPPFDRHAERASRHAVESAREAVAAWREALSYERAFWERMRELERESRARSTDGDG